MNRLTSIFLLIFSFIFLQACTEDTKIIGTSYKLEPKEFDNIYTKRGSVDGVNPFASWKNKLFVPPRPKWDVNSDVSFGVWIAMPNKVAELPDKPKDFYTGAQPSDPILNGHRGPHCKNGYTTGINRGKCVMFGAAGVPDFCSDCKACVLKVDCSASTLEAK